jgi:hypothetical protein
VLNSIGDYFFIKFLWLIANFLSLHPAPQKAFFSLGLGQFKKMPHLCKTKTAHAAR